MSDRDTIYLDTYVVVWLYASGGDALSAMARERIDGAEWLRISPMVRLELVYLNELGRVTEPAATILDYLAQRIGLATCDHPFAQVVAKAADFSWTRDPFDRLITAQAALGENTLLTKDAVIREHYPRAEW